MMTSRREQHPDTGSAPRARRAASSGRHAGRPGTGAHRVVPQREQRAARKRAGEGTGEPMPMRTAERFADPASGGSERPGGRGKSRERGKPGESGNPGESGERRGLRPPAHFDAYLDGLFTYCLSVMCEHDTATAALGEALAVAERQRLRDRAPTDPAQHRPWLYALARWSCLRRLNANAHAVPAEPLSPRAAERRRRELGALAWPEAAGTAPEQREALELAVRHRLPVHEVAAVLARPTAVTRELLSSGACEVERTRAALAVVATGGCPTVAAIAAGSRQGELRLSTALCRELVRHVDECPGCRRSAERLAANGPWPGTAPTGTGSLPLLVAPRPAVHAALLLAQRARLLHAPRFDRRGFPLADRDRTARREKLRSRAVTTTVVATVIAAPVLAVWAAYRGAPLTGEAREEATVTAVEAEDEDGARGYPPDGEHSHGDLGPGGRSGDGRPAVTVTSDERGEHPGEDAADHPVDPGGTPAEPSPSPGPDGGATTAPAPSRLTVEAGTADGATVITLRNPGGSPVSWSASTDAAWLRLSHTSGTLRPGESATVRVTVDRDAEPAGTWSARIHIAPADAVVTVEGEGAAPDPGPSEPPQDPGPSDPPPSGDPSGEPSTEPSSTPG
ncbi:MULTISPECIES: BACON domain-containing protein [unclassified Streptomyces]|uniref:BACON domain-containing protein n=1 Tax=unclassified Streptomyces TaxID=2593676 RepID=UPI0022B697A2|nr:MULTISPECIES: sigma-70 family RNA polymerase sigma factor [unclassified Streptomyces]MCZ7415042.1 sigma-70 family RNA polymerase sigma factor [Streptomyces sp. WMMC897]MCZ7431985.1 sigma-70 family RNA polymerase sigma factor [Streptomyces sp. WMMC1477]